MNLRNFDLNLLLVLDAMLRERSVIRAAEALALSQPALSHALNRLRYLLKDRLFVRTPEGMMPTPRAEQLALPVRKALNDLELALEMEKFSPATADRRFVIAVNNYAAVTLAGPIVATCQAQAPKVQLSLRPSGTLTLPSFWNAANSTLQFLQSARRPNVSFHLRWSRTIMSRCFGGGIRHCGAN